MSNPQEPAKRGIGRHFLIWTGIIGAIGCYYFWKTLYQEDSLPIPSSRQQPLNRDQNNDPSARGNPAKRESTSTEPVSTRGDPVE